MFLDRVASLYPDRTAFLDADTGGALTYSELHARAVKVSAHLHSHGLNAGDNVALYCENSCAFVLTCWGALMAGLNVALVNTQLTPREVSHILANSESRAIISSAALAPNLDGIVSGALHLLVDGELAGWIPVEGDAADANIGEPPLGGTLFYTAGTTGRPKGLWRPLPFRGALPNEPPQVALYSTLQMDHNCIYLSTAPLYHSAPFHLCFGVMALGGTVVCMRRFDAAKSLELLALHRVTHSQWVPTMFVRLLRLNREAYATLDLSVHRVAVHGAAPCPVWAKSMMIEWWGPILYEVYGSTEGNGSTLINSAEWLQRPGSVGRSLYGTLHICGEDGRELDPLEPGVVYFENHDYQFQYYGDSHSTRLAAHPSQPAWTTVGDMGYVDHEGYLYLTGRCDFIIVSGGVNISPQPIEDALLEDPLVQDAAVFGVPSQELGEEVKAVVELAPGHNPSPDLARQLLDNLRPKLARFELPKTLDFVESLPRLATGKLAKHKLQNDYAIRIRRTGSFGLS